MEKKNRMAELLNKTAVETNRVEQIAAAVHGNSAPKEKTKRVSLDTPLSVYKKAKNKSVDLGLTMKDYLLMLIEKDVQN
jgi:hypothetical protein